MKDMKENKNEGKRWLEKESRMRRCLKIEKKRKGYTLTKARRRQHYTQKR